MYRGERNGRSLMDGRGAERRRVRWRREGIWKRRKGKSEETEEEEEKGQIRRQNKRGKGVLTEGGKWEKCRKDDGNEDIKREREEEVETNSEKKMGKPENIGE